MNKHFTRLSHLILKNRLSTVLFVILIAACVYSGAYSSFNLSSNSDAIVYPYLFENIPGNDQLLVSDKHSNILKMPFFAIQALIPYDLISFMLFNMALYMATILLWVYLCIKILGTKSINIILVSAIAVVLGAQVFNNEIIYATSRNIEYPIILFYFYLLGQIIYREKISRNWVRGFFAYALLVASMISGDQFFIYIALVPTLLLLLLAAITKQAPRSRLLLGLGSVALIYFAANFIKTILDKVGLFDLDKRYLSESTLLSLKDLPATIHAIFNQWQYMMGMAIPFRISSRSLLDGMFFALAGLALCGLIFGAYLFLVNRSRKNRALLFTGTLLFASTTTLLLAYTLSGLAHQGDSPEESNANIRYISLLPLVLIFGTGYASLLSTKIQKRKQLFIFAIILPLIIASYSIIKVNHQNFANAFQSRADYKALAATLQQRGVTQVLSGYWYGAALRFWSHDTIRYAVVADCNKPSIENARRDWYVPSPDTKKTALVIDMSGRDLPFLGYCSGEKLIKTYGKPTGDGQFTTGPILNSRINLWYYNYDIRSKVRPISID